MVVRLWRDGGASGRGPEPRAYPGHRSHSRRRYRHPLREHLRCVNSVPLKQSACHVCPTFRSSVDQRTAAVLAREHNRRGRVARLRRTGRCPDPESASRLGPTIRGLTDDESWLASLRSWPLATLCASTGVDIDGRMRCAYTLSASRHFVRLAGRGGRRSAPSISSRGHSRHEAMLFCPIEATVEGGPEGHRERHPGHPPASVSGVPDLLCACQRLPHVGCGRERVH